MIAYMTQPCLDCFHVYRNDKRITGVPLAFEDACAWIDTEIELDVMAMIRLGITMSQEIDSRSGAHGEPSRKVILDTLK